MLTTALIVAALLGGQVSVIATTPAPATRSAPAEGTETRRVCRLERATGSNMQQRVCRNRPLAGSAQDQQTREFMSAMQRVKIPETFEIPTPGLGGVSSPH